MRPTPAVAIATALLAGSVSTAAPSSAQLPTVSPGDRIDFISDHQHTQSYCTLGYVYAVASPDQTRVYGVTAGHCQPDMPGHFQAATGAAGTFVRTQVAPPHTGGPDYGVIDFGTQALAVAFIGTIPIAAGPPSTPHPGTVICHTGVSSGEHCGTIARRYGTHQLLTTGMPPSIPGDSGGPVWYRDRDGAAHVIGIWLGEKDTADGRHGRFATLAAAGLPYR